MTKFKVGNIVKILDKSYHYKIDGTDYKTWKISKIDDIYQIKIICLQDKNEWYWVDGINLQILKG